MNYRTPMDTNSFRHRLDRDGFAVIPDILPPDAVEALRRAISGLTEGDAVRRRGGVYGIRNLIGVSREVRDLAASAEIWNLVTPILGDGCFAARATYFDKIRGANWKIPWHQDSMIAVRERIDVAGFGPWSVKAGVIQVQPPVTVLERMLAVRLHLDDCGPDNGALRVLPGSHRHGWLDAEIDRWKKEVAEVCCSVNCGGALVMRPLILHASSPAAAPRHRRVIHIEYACDELPGGLQWHDRINRSNRSGPPPSARGT
jgi:hypothetical protein